MRTKKVELEKIAQKMIENAEEQIYIKKTHNRVIIYPYVVNNNINLSNKEMEILLKEVLKRIDKNIRIHFLILEDEFISEIEIDIWGMIAKITKINGEKINDDKTVIEIEYTKKLRGTPFIKEHIKMEKIIKYNKGEIDIEYKIKGGNLKYMNGYEIEKYIKEKVSDIISI